MKYILFTIIMINLNFLTAQELVIGEETIEPGIVFIFEGAIKDHVAPMSMHLAEKETHVHIEARVNWDEKNISSSCRIRLAEPSDLPDIENIAASSFLFSRFHLDPKVQDSVANQIKRQWAINFFAGKRGDCMIVAKNQNKTVGFTLILDQKEKRTIDLIAVSKRYQGKGMASAMIRSAAEGALGKQIVVGTQVANFPSLRSYENLGFRIYESYYVLHYHGPVAK